MKKLLVALFVTAALALPVTRQAFAESKGKEITVTGKGMCNKCCLKKGDTCENVVQVEKDGKDGKKTKVTYHLADNQLSKDFHDNICKKVQPVTFTGTCKKEGENLVVTCSKIALAK